METQVHEEIVSRLMPSRNMRHLICSERAYQTTNYDDIAAFAVWQALMGGTEVTTAGADKATSMFLSQLVL